MTATTLSPHLLRFLTTPPRSFVSQWLRVIRPSLQLCYLDMRVYCFYEHLGRSNTFGCHFGADALIWVAACLWSGINCIWSFVYPFLAARWDTLCKCCEWFRPSFIPSGKVWQRIKTGSMLRVREGTGYSVGQWCLEVNLSNFFMLSEFSFLKLKGSTQPNVERFAGRKGSFPSFSFWKFSSC